MTSLIGDPSFVVDRLTRQIGYTPVLIDKTTYRLVVRARDRAGNVSELTATFTVDTSVDDVDQPVVTALYPQPGATINDSGLDSLLFTLADTTGIDPASVYLFINDPTGRRPLPLGRLVAAGAAAYNDETGAVRIDTKILTAALLGSRGGFSFDPLELQSLERSLTGGGASFDPLELHSLERSLNSGATGGANVASLERSLANGAGILGAGTNQIGVQASDLFGNVTLASWEFNVALDPPQAPTLDPLPSLTNQPTATVSGVVKSLSASALPVAVAVRVNGAVVGRATVTDINGVFSVANATLSSGANAISATAQDGAGNVSAASATVTVILDRTPPTVTLNAPTTPSKTPEIDLTGDIADNRAEPLASVVLVLNGNATTLPAKTGRFTTRLMLTEGANTFQVRATDAAGNVGVSTETTVTLPPSAPTTAPTTLTALPTSDGRGIALQWAADAAAVGYDVYRATTAFTSAAGMTPIASNIAATAYADRSVSAGTAVYYAVVSVDRTGKRDATKLSPVRRVTLIPGSGGTARSDDGATLAVPSRGLFANSLLGATALFDATTDVPTLENAVGATAHRIAAFGATGDAVTTFNRAATLTLPIPLETTLNGATLKLFRLDGGAWVEVASATNTDTRVVTASIDRAGVYRVAVGHKPGDLSGDGVIDIVDLVSLARRFGQSGADLGGADLNGDGVINLFDLVMVARQFGLGNAAAAPTRVNGNADALVTLRYTDDGAVIAVESSVPVGGYQLSVEADATATVSNGDLYAQPFFWVKPRDGSAVIELAATSLDQSRAERDAPKRSGVLARLTTGDRPVSVRDIRLTDATGNRLSVRVQVEPLRKAAPAQTRLFQNYPNPFNPETWIPFELSSDAQVRIDIYDQAGRHVRGLELGYLSAGEYVSRPKAAHWDGRNELGERVASGLYLVRIQAGSYTATRRMIVVK